MIIALFGLYYVMKISNTKSPKTTKQKKKSRSKLTSDLDKVFSQWIRRKYADSKWLVKCYTCWVKKTIWEMQNWHFITRGCMLLRRDPRNCRPQCVWCNIYKSGNYIEYTSNMIKEVWIDEVDILRKQKLEIKKRSLNEIEEMIEYYKSDLINY